MRILFVNDGVNDAGGVQSYLDAVAPGLAARGHEIFFLYYDESEGEGRKPHPFTHFSVKSEGVDSALGKARALKPDVCFSHNMNSLEVERRLLDFLPVVKFMHGYFGTCIGGQKAHFFPSPVACHQPFGKSCLAQYFPRRCGELSLEKMLTHYSWAREQHRLFEDYASVIVASRHMKHEYVSNGMDENKITVNPLFPSSLPVALKRARDDAAGTPRILFMGRMTKLKGGDLLIRAVALASRKLGRKLELLMVGDGPQRNVWEALARRLRVPHRFTGWVSDETERARLMEQSTVLAVPSVWPEPFGLVGLEAGWAGVPAVAFDVGGISEWLSDGVNGLLVPARPRGAARFAEALVEILSQPDRLFEMGSAARERAREMSLDIHLDRLETVLAAACGQEITETVGLKLAGNY